MENSASKFCLYPLSKLYSFLFLIIFSSKEALQLLHVIGINKKRMFQTITFSICNLFSQAFQFSIYFSLVRN